MKKFITGLVLVAFLTLSAAPALAQAPQAARIDGNALTVYSTDSTTEGNNSAPKILTFYIESTQASPLVALKGKTAAFDFSASHDNLMIRAIQITATPQKSTLQLTGIRSQKIGLIFGEVTSPTDANKKLTYGNRTFDLSRKSKITMTDLLGSSIYNGDISLGSLRALFGSYVTFDGKLSNPGNASNFVHLTLDLGNSK